jgi:DNA-binding response OmpR family regulator
VLAAGTSGEASRVLRAHGAPVSLVLSDLVLPDESGFEAVARLKSSGFGGEVIFMSGYLDRPELETGMHAGAHFLRKPFLGAELCAAIRRALDARAAKTV